MDNLNCSDPWHDEKSLSSKVYSHCPSCMNSLEINNERLVKAINYARIRLSDIDREAVDKILKGLVY